MIDPFAREESFTARLARYSVETTNIPSELADQANHVLVEVLSLEVLAWDHPIVDTLCGLVTSLVSPPQATLLGRGLKIGASYAAMVNATAGRVKSTSFASDSAALVFVPATVAIGELVNASRDQLLAGIVVGLGSARLLAQALGRGHIERGWDPLGTVGRVAAGLAVTRVLELTYEQTVSAIGFASTQAAGFMGAEGSTIAPLIAGKAAADGLEAALFARAGLIGPAAPLEGRRGLFALEAGNFTKEAANAFGSEWDAPSSQNPYLDVDQTFDRKEASQFSAIETSIRHGSSMESLLHDVHHLVIARSRSQKLRREEGA